MSKSCMNCIFEKRGTHEIPCCNCDYNRYTGKGSKHISKRCNNCKYEKVAYGKEPCKTCMSEASEYSRYELPENAFYELPNGTILELKEKTETKEENNAVQHPTHYQGKYECIDEMIELFGIEDVKAFFRCSAYKYRFRAGKKQGVEYEKDIAEAENCIAYLMRLNGKEWGETV